MRSIRPLFIAALAATALSGCAKTNLTNLWKSPDASAPLRSILVVSLERDEELRRMWEDAISAELMANGVMARPGYSLFPASLPDSQQVVTVTRRDNYDGVLVAHRIPTTHTGRMDTNDYTKTSPGGATDYWRGWYHTHYMQAVQSAPFGEGEASFQLDLANSAGGGALLWTGSTTPVDPRDEKKVREEVCGELVSELVRQGLVTKRK